MASSNTPSNNTPLGQSQASQNDTNQTQATIAEKLNEVIAAQEKPPPVNQKQVKSKNSFFSRPKPKDDRDQSPPSSFDDYPRARCLMFFPTSGRMGFDRVKTSEELPSIETVREMIAYETSIRLSEPVQEFMESYHKDEAALRFILDLIQQHVVEYFGYHDVNALRTALHRFPNDPAVKEAFYVKHNKVTQGLVNQGECIRDVELYTIDGQITNLFSHIPVDQPLILLAGSTS
jgi:hypothetical protein